MGPDHARGTTDHPGSRYYAAFAGWLAQQGIRAVTFDYRGMDDAAALRSETADVDRWAAEAAAVLAAVSDEAAGLPVT